MKKLQPFKRSYCRLCVNVKTVIVNDDYLPFFTLYLFFDRQRK